MGDISNSISNNNLVASVSRESQPGLRLSNMHELSSHLSCPAVENKRENKIESWHESRAKRMRMRYGLIDTIQTTTL